MAFIKVLAIGVMLFGTAFAATYFTLQGGNSNTGTFGMAVVVLGAVIYFAAEMEGDLRG